MSFKKDLNNIHDKSYKDLFSTNDAFLSFVNTSIQGYKCHGVFGKIENIVINFNNLSFEEKFIKDFMLHTY
ncbi:MULTISPECIES: hypothetical protein [Clostridium]|uniref:Uncharacterized protein n=1 Tax=Clostridium frigoriphilum TaxID=443253 RepID=A0ABU7UTA5_9CLOT|nr:hypothetical protein [Clostridium sp. DSM 17811]MBU3102175.1 hypothetical protein [Clostridium sp. DSM 17811]